MGDQLAVFQSLMAQVATGVGTFRESSDQGKMLMDAVRNLPEEVRVDCLKTYLDVILRDTFNIVAARQYCTEFASAIQTFSRDVQKQIIPVALEKMHSRVISFEEQVCRNKLISSIIENIVEKKKKENQG